MVCGLKKPTAKKKFSPVFEKFSNFLIASLAPIPSVCSSSTPPEAIQLKVPPNLLGLRVLILYSSSLSLPYGLIV